MDWNMGKLPHQKEWMRYVVLAGVAAAGAATLAAAIRHLSEARLARKLSRCADQIQKSLPVLERAADLYLAEHESLEPPHEAVPVKRAKKEKRKRRPAEG